MLFINSTVSDTPVMISKCFRLAAGFIAGRKVGPQARQQHKSRRTIMRDPARQFDNGLVAFRKISRLRQIEKTRIQWHNRSGRTGATTIRCRITLNSSAAI